MKLGALTAPGRKRGGERSRVWALCAGSVVVLVEARWENYTDAPEARVLIRFSPRRVEPIGLSARWEKCRNFSQL